MRSSSFARVVIASLGLGVVMTLGCDKSPSMPSRAEPFSVLSISPTVGSSGGETRAKITGTGFTHNGQVFATVTVDGRPVLAGSSFDGKTINLVMPAHATGKVEVIVTAPLSQVQANVPGGYTYVPPPPPVIREVLPNTGTTGGGTPITIVGSGFLSPVSVSVGGIATPFDVDDFGVDVLYLTTPAHAAGTVEVIVTEQDGRTGSDFFTYVSPAAFDFNGVWQGFAASTVVVTIRDNTVVSVSCGTSSLTLDPPPVVANGEFSFVGSGGVSITGRILSADFASGSINMASCAGPAWFSRKKQ